MNKKINGVEANGPANIVMMIEAYGNNLTPEQIQKIKNEALKTVEYINKLSNPECVEWSSIKVA